MGTNYYRIPTEAEVEERKNKLLKSIQEMELTPENIERDFSICQGKTEWDWHSPWEEFTKEIKVHLGKRSSGWQFCWNFNDNRHYHNRKTLLDFIRKGRVVDEYGKEISVDEFITMAFEWGQPDGWRFNSEYVAHRKKENPEYSSIFDNPMYYDRDVDGLRVSRSTEFS